MYDVTRISDEVTAAENNTIREMLQTVPGLKRADLQV